MGRKIQYETTEAHLLFAVMQAHNLLLHHGMDGVPIVVDEPGKPAQWAFVKNNLDTDSITNITKPSLNG